MEGKMHRSRLDLKKVLSEIDAMGKYEQKDVQQRQDLLKEALELIHELARRQDAVRDRIFSITQVDSGIRCAIPGEEIIDQSIPLDPNPSPPVTIVSADGSQFIQTEDDPVEFAVINTGLFRWLPDGHTTEEICITQLLHHENLYENGWVMSDELFRLKRDAEERVALVEQCLCEKSPVIGLVDGPIELFRQSGDDDRTRKITETYMTSLNKMADTDCILAGYIDHPKANLVLQMMSLAILAEDQPQNARFFQPFGRLRDADLFKHLLPPGSRSAIFGVRSTSTHLYRGKLALKFFYLNVAPPRMPNSPWIARVEIPEWVAANPASVSILQKNILSQCHFLNLPYPFCLIRAHEIALVRWSTGNELAQIIQKSYRDLGIKMRETSMKTQLKGMIG
jgi:hypothetical protein